MQEVAVVIECVEESLNKLKINDKPVVQSDIGVLTPYSQQCHEIRDKLSEKGYGEITVGSAEIYQGQQRPVIIVSTVRTGDDIGFVDDGKVFYQNSSLR